MTAAPDAVFVYGTLMPRQPRWPVLSEYVAGPAEPAAVRGVLLDTGAGYPALTGVGRGPWVPGFLVSLDPATAQEALRVLDEIEGTPSGLYARVRITTRAGSLAWTYEYRRSTSGMRPLPAGWAAHLGTGGSW
jgi:gamma-glutamylcyclotransferase (GGCT)/AIG2-like uncharacterized protein YtfP